MISLAAKTASIKEPKRSSALVRQETIASYLFLLPSLIFFLGFVIYPMILCVVTSFFDSTMNRADVFVGFANYAELFADPIFIGALRNTFIIVVVSVPVTCAFSLWVSSAIVDLPEWATSLFRCVFYLPVVTGSVAVTVVWKWMYNNRFGVFNYLFKSLGIIDQNINWLGDARFALWCIILILFTTSVGQPIVLYVSALGNVALDLLFVLVFPWGVAGAAWATVIAQYFSGLGLAVFTLRRCPDLLPKREELRFDAARTLLDYAFANYTLVMPETGAPDVPVSLGKAASVRAVCESSGTVLIEKARQKELSAVYELPEKVDAPVAAGQLLGTLRYVAGSETIASVPISAAESVERVGAGELWVRLAAALCGRTNTQ